MNAHVRSSLMQAVQRMNGSPVAVRESDTNFLLNIQSVFQMSADEDDFDLDAEERIAAERNRNLCAAYGMAPAITITGGPNSRIGLSACSARSMSPDQQNGIAATRCPCSGSAMIPQ